MFQSNKRLIIIFIIVWLFLLSITVLGVLYLNNKKSVIDNNQVATYNTRSYYSFYDDNNINIKLLYADKTKNHQAYGYIKIDGLKNTQIQNKINKEIYDYTLNEINNKATNIYPRVKLNAFNILSVYISSSKETESKYMAFNYDLNTGNQIKFTDLFTNTANLSSIIYDGVYNKLSTDISFSILSLERQIKAAEIYNENGMESQWYNGNDVAKLKKEKTEKEQELNNIEDTALNETRKIINSNNISFYLTNYGIIIFKPTDNYEITLKAEKNMEYFAYYEKYLNNKSLYKENNIGKKHIFLSGKNNNDLSYNRVEELDDYALIDFEKWYDYNEDEISYMDKLINEYKNKLDKNIFSYLNINSYYYKAMNSNIGSIDGYITLCKMSKDYYKDNYKKKLFKTKLDTEYSNNSFYNDEKNDNIKCTTNKLSLLVNNGKFYDKVSDIFVDNYDYQAYLITKYYENNNENYDETNINIIKNKFTFGFTGYGGIYIDYLGNNEGDYFQYDLSINIEDIPKEYLKIKF